MSHRLVKFEQTVGVGFVKSSVAQLAMEITKASRIENTSPEEAPMVVDELPKRQMP